MLKSVQALLKTKAVKSGCYETLRPAKRTMRRCPCERGHFFHGLHRGRGKHTLFPTTLEDLIPQDHVCRVIVREQAGRGGTRVCPCRGGRDGASRLRSARSAEAVSVGLPAADPFIASAGGRVPAYSLKWTASRIRVHGAPQANRRLPPATSHRCQSSSERFARRRDLRVLPADGSSAWPADLQA
jgi:hypothetical protein